MREVTLSGTTIRLIGESAFRDAVRGVDASNSLIAVASYNGPTLLHTFDIHTGALVCEADSRLGAGTCDVLVRVLVTRGTILHTV